MVLKLRIVWTQVATMRLRRIGDFIAKDKPRAAQQLLKTIRKSVKLLERNPFMGRRTEFEGVRELVVHANYLVSYRVSNDLIEILQVWHAAQQRYH